MNNPNLPSQSKLYWTLQVLGWSGMASIAILNYSIFASGAFSWKFAAIQFAAAMVGLLFSHFYKKFFLTSEIWEKSFVVIFFKALQAILIITFAMSAVTQSVVLVQSSFVYTPISFAIQFVIQVLNFGVFVAPWVTIYFIYKIVNKNREITEQKLWADALTKSSELELLKSQLNPHFLFNALNSIKALVLLDGEKAGLAISKLKELLNFTLNHQKYRLIPLGKELAEVEKYLDLEKIRFGKRLEFSIEARPETLEVGTPPAMLLTLAENAIKHGLNHLPEGGLIRIQAELVKNELILKLTNSGQLKKNALPSGIGLKTIRNRLMHLFGEQGELDLRQLPNMEVSAILRHPANNSKEAISANQTLISRKEIGISEQSTTPIS
ncbi:sensor histidine kinase [Pararhodonellum marinum]|uniref:sensor histidine kinase n=1 Tax=Pararhodonellum marinum TaxID=2755358 RepID=UPI00188DD48F|nr:histidine kinase [Pararhodonellum marinum]